MPTLKWALQTESSESNRPSLSLINLDVSLNRVDRALWTESTKSPDWPSKVHHDKNRLLHDYAEKNDGKYTQFFFKMMINVELFLHFSL